MDDSKNIMKYLGFLVEDYQMQFSFQTFDEYNGFAGPINTYSFYNEYGCFTIHHIVQRNEWGWYISRNMSEDQYELLENEIIQTDFITAKCLSPKKMLKALAGSVQFQISASKSFFGIRINS